jgi:nucleoside-diphosphate-sugar epimerase
VVITGATSFVGMHLCNIFAKNEWRVIAGHLRKFSAYASPQLERIKQIAKAVEFVQFDITDQKDLTNIVEKYVPKLWIHHAGYTTDYADLNFDYKSGLTINAGSIPLVFKALKGQACGVIITGTEAEYGPAENVHFESDIPRPSSLYGVSKLAQTITAQQQSEFYNIPTRVARLFLPFGTFDHPRKVISLVIDSLRNNRPIELSPCTQKRDFIGVQDLCEAYFKLAKDLDRGGFDIFNVCSGEATELKTLIELIADALNADHQLLKFGKIPMRTGEPNLIVGDNSKASNVLSWIPRHLTNAIQEDLNLIA